MIPWGEVLGYVAMLCNVVGNLMLASMSVRGWVVRILTNILYIIYAVQVTGGMPVVLNHVVFLGINGYGLWKWRKRLTAGATI